MTETLSADLPLGFDKRVHRLLERICLTGLRLATAESCTGGLLASLLTDVEGCGHAFDRGFVVYTNEAKREMLGVPTELIDTHGAVSAAVARAMSEGALDRSEADIALAVTGFAGPTGGRGEEGLVHYACAFRGRPTIHREAHYGAIGRGGVRLECLKAGMEMLEEILD